MPFAGPGRRAVGSRHGRDSARQWSATDPHRHRHRRDLHRRRRVRRVRRHHHDDEDAVDPRRSGRGLHGRHRQGARPDRRHVRRHRRRLARHHRGDQPAARGQGRRARLRHEHRLRGDAGDRPAVGARRLRQLLLLGQAASHRAPPPGARRRGQARLHRGRAAPLRRERCPRGRAVVPRAGHRHPGRLLPARLCQPRPRGADARDPARGAPRCGRVAEQRGPAGVPRVRARDDHPRRRRREAAAESLRQQHQAAADREERPVGSVLRHEVQRGSALGRRGRAPADHHGAVRSGRGCAGCRADRQGRRLRQGADQRRWRHVDRRLGGHRRRADPDHRGLASAPTRRRSR